MAALQLSLSLRDVETILAARGIPVSYETIREWGLRFGRLFANDLKRRRPRPGNKWHLDEVFIQVQGKLHYLWRAVDQHGYVLDILVQSRRHARTAYVLLDNITQDPGRVERMKLLAGVRHGMLQALARLSWKARNTVPPPTLTSRHVPGSPRQPCYPARSVA